MIGQLQGKFQLVIVPGVGHLVHEVRVHMWALAVVLADHCVDRTTQPGRRRFYSSSGEGTTVLSQE